MTNYKARSDFILSAAYIILLGVETELFGRLSGKVSTFPQVYPQNVSEFKGAVSRYFLLFSPLSSFHEFSTQTCE